MIDLARRDITQIYCMSLILTTTVSDVYDLSFFDSISLFDIKRKKFFKIFVSGSVIKDVFCVLNENLPFQVTLHLNTIYPAISNQ